MSTLLTSIFASKPADDYILVWQAKTKNSYWFKDVESLLPTNNPSLYNKGDVYFGVGTSRENKGKFHRCPADEISGIGAFWLDIDVKSEAHKKGNLPENYEDAWEILKKTFPHPSCIINSGHGLQAYWYLDCWYNLTGETPPRTFMQEKLLIFNTYWRLYCARLGFDADSVCDLARVMRLPGSLNCKIADEKREVREWDHGNGVRYPITDLVPAQSLQEITRELESIKRGKPAPVKAPAKVIEDKSIQLDQEKWEILKEIDKRAQATWDMHRPDLADQSASAYTMALGRLALNAGWEDQEIFSLLTAFRASRGWDIKEAAIRLTIKKMHDTPSGFDTFDTQDPEEKKPISLEAISNSIGLEINQLIRFDTSPPAYVLVTLEEKRINLGGIEGLTDIKKFRNIVAATTGIMPVRFKPDAWDKVIQGLLTFTTHDSAGSEATEEGQLVEWIQVYLNSVTVHEDPETGLTAGEPWLSDGHIHIIGTAFRGWIAVNLQDRIESRRLGITLRTIKAEPVKFKTRNVWKLPKGVWSK